MVIPAEVRDDARAACMRAAEEFCRAASESVRARGRFDAALSGGSTPRALYALLADPTRPFRRRVPWSRVHAFWGDERHVPPGDAQSNFGMAWRELISRVPIPVENVHRVPAELSDAAEAARVYERMLQGHFRGRVRFDLVLLGLGPDGHTASLFPKSTGLSERRRCACENWSPATKSWRITLTFPAINAARRAVFLVCGEEKAGVVRRVFSGDRRLPAARVRPSQGSLLWILDREAASRITK